MDQDYADLPWDFQPLQGLTFEIFRTSGTWSPFLKTERKAGSSWFRLDCWKLPCCGRVTTEHPLLSLPHSEPWAKDDKGKPQVTWAGEARRCEHLRGQNSKNVRAISQAAAAWKSTTFHSRCLIPTTLHNPTDPLIIIYWPFPRSRMSLSAAIVATKYPLRSFDHCLTLRITGVWTVTLLYRRN